MKIWKQTINLLPLHWYCTFWQRQVGFPHIVEVSSILQCVSVLQHSIGESRDWWFGQLCALVECLKWSRKASFFFFLSVSLSLDLSNYEWGYWQAEGKYDDSFRWFYFLPVCYLAMANISIISDANISYL